MGGASADGTQALSRTMSVIGMVEGMRRSDEDQLRQNTLFEHQLSSLKVTDRHNSIKLAEAEADEIKRKQIEEKYANADLSKQVDYYGAKTTAIKEELALHSNPWKAVWSAKAVVKELITDKNSLGGLVFKEANEYRFGSDPKMDQHMSRLQRNSPFVMHDVLMGQQVDDPNVVDAQGRKGKTTIGALEAILFDPSEDEAKQARILKSMDDDSRNQYLREINKQNSKKGESLQGVMDITRTAAEKMAELRAIETRLNSTPGAQVEAAWMWGNTSTVGFNPEEMQKYAELGARLKEIKLQIPTYSRDAQGQVSIGKPLDETALSIAKNGMSDYAGKSETSVYLNSGVITPSLMKRWDKQIALDPDDENSRVALSMANIDIRTKELNKNSRSLRQRELINQMDMPVIESAPDANGVTSVKLTWDIMPDKDRKPLMESWLKLAANIGDNPNEVDDSFVEEALSMRDKILSSKVGTMATVGDNAKLLQTAQMKASLFDSVIRAEKERRETIKKVVQPPPASLGTGTTVKASGFADQVSILVDNANSITDPNERDAFIRRLSAASANPATSEQRRKIGYAAIEKLTPDYVPPQGGNADEDWDAILSFAGGTGAGAVVSAATSKMSKGIAKTLVARFNSTERMAKNLGRASGIATDVAAYEGAQVVMTKAGVSEDNRMLANWGALLGTILGSFGPKILEEVKAAKQAWINTAPPDSFAGVSRDLAANIISSIKSVGRQSPEVIADIQKEYAKLRAISMLSEKAINKAGYTRGELADQMKFLKQIITQ
jgi:hypothetical protein